MSFIGLSKPVQQYSTFMTNFMPMHSSIGTRLLCSNFYLLYYAALLKNFAYYAQIMLIEIEQFPGIYPTILMHCLQICTFIGK